MSEINAQIARLATNLQRMRPEEGQFIDARGELVDTALQSSFRGGSVETLVDRGIGQEGSFAGRDAVALVGQEHFDLLRRSARELSSTSVCNVLRLLTQLESEGLDSDLQWRVIDTIHSKFSGNTPIHELTVENLQTLHETIQDKVLPQRRAYRQGLLAAVTAGHPTPAMRNASQAALLVAGRGLEEKLDQAPNPYKELNQLFQEEGVPITTGQGRSIPQGAYPILREYQVACTHLRASGQADDTALREQFIGVLQQTYATKDIEDGLHVRQDGSAVRVKSRSKPKSEGIAEYLTFGGVEEKQVPSATTGNWVRDFRHDLDAAVASGNKEEILVQAKRLGDITRGPGHSAADKLMAHALKQKEAFLNDYDCVKEVLGAGKRWKFNEETTAIYRPNARRFKAVIQNKIRELDTLIAQPESHPDYAAYQEVFSDPRVGGRFGSGREGEETPPPVDGPPRIIEEAEEKAGGRFGPKRGGGETPPPVDGRAQIIQEAKETRAIARRLLRLPVFKT